MESPKTNALRRGIKQRRLDGTISQKELQEALHRLGEVALEEGNLYEAVQSFMELNDRERLRIAAERCFSSDGWLFDSYRAFAFLNDREGLLRVIRKEKDALSGEIMNGALRDFIGEETVNKVYEGFRSWCSEKGYDDAHIFPIGVAANLAYNLVSNHDLGIGVAKGGLFSTYMARLFGLNTKVIEMHRKGKGATFRLVDEIKPSDIEGKRVVVFDKDVVSGRTTRRALTEIKKYKPGQLNLALFHDSVESGTIGIGTVASNIPDGFDHVYYSGSFNYRDFDKVVEGLERSLVNG